MTPYGGMDQIKACRMIGSEPLYKQLVISEEL